MQAVIIGGTGGIGRVVTARLLAENWDVLATGRRPATLDALTRALPASTRLTTLRLDVTCDRDVARLVEHVNADGPETPPSPAQPSAGLALLVVAHGAEPVATPATRLPIATLQRIIETDVTGTFRVCRALAPLMARNGGGTMVLVASFHALATYPERTHYSAAKTAVAGLTRGLAVEWGVQGIRVVCLAPGQVEGPRTTRFLEAARRDGVDLRERMVRRAPARSLVDPADLAEAVLACTRIPSLTGQTIVLDHGWLASNWHGEFTENGLCGV
jgi:NAD(P)-dependent dehydrogenase (short-subunit alcohol dehydrogenase family)